MVECKHENTYTIQWVDQRGGSFKRVPIPGYKFCPLCNRILKMEELK